MTKAKYLPNGWHKLPLIEVCVDARNAIVDGPFGSNLKTIHYRKSGIPIIQSRYVTSGNFICNEYIYVDEAKFKLEIRSKVEAGDIVMAKIGENCGRSAILPHNHAQSILSGNTLKITINQNKYSNLYYWYFLEYSYALTKFSEIKSKGAQPAISMSSLKQLKVPVPPLAEQHKIVQILSVWDKAIEKMLLLIKCAKQKQQQLQKSCKTIAKKYGVIQKFDDVFVLQIGGTPSRSNTEYWATTIDKGFPWASISDLKSKHLDNTKEKITSLGIKKSNVKLIPLNTTLISFKLTLGRRAVTKIPIYTNEAICALIPKNPTRILSNFVYHAAGWVDYNLYVDQAVKGKTLNKEKIKQLPIITPPIKIQEKIATLLGAIDYEVSLLEKLLKYYKTEKNGLMQKLLTGKIRVKI